MMLNLTDFKRGDDRWTDYIAEITLLGEKIELDVSFGDALGKTEETLAAALPAINSKLRFMETNKEAVLLSTVDDAHLDELAEEWLYELVEDEDDTEVELEDGSTVPVEVTPERFMESLFPVAFGFDFKKSTAQCSAYLELLCEPDYFAGHRIHIKISEENEISCDGI